MPTTTTKRYTSSPARDNLKTRRTTPDRNTTTQTETKITETRSYTRQKSPDKKIDDKQSRLNRKSPSPSKRTPSPDQKSTRSTGSTVTQPTSSWISRTTTTSTSSTTPQLKKTVISTQPADDKPEWVTQKILKKVDRNEPPKRPGVNRLANVKLNDLKTKKEEDVKDSKVSKVIEPTSCITSSYGVGPMDESGRPMFGLKALRHQSSFNKNNTQGKLWI